MVIKINKRNKMQDRILLMTGTSYFIGRHGVAVLTFLRKEQAVYNIDPSGYKMKRRIPIREVGAVSLSKLPDNFFCLHVPSEYVLDLASSRPS